MRTGICHSASPRPVSPVPVARTLLHLVLSELTATQVIVGCVGRCLATRATAAKMRGAVAYATAYLLLTPGLPGLSVLLAAGPNGHALILSRGVSACCLNLVCFMHNTVAADWSHTGQSPFHLSAHPQVAGLYRCQVMHGLQAVPCTAAFAESPAAQGQCPAASAWLSRGRQPPGPCSWGWQRGLCPADHHSLITFQNSTASVGGILAEHLHTVSSIPAAATPMPGVMCNLMFLAQSVVDARPCAEACTAMVPRDMLPMLAAWLQQARGPRRMPADGPSCCWLADCRSVLRQTAR